MSDCICVTDKNDVYQYFEEYWHPVQSNLQYLMHKKEHKRIIIYYYVDQAYFNKRSSCYKCYHCYGTFNIKELQYKYPETVSLSLEKYFKYKHNYHFREIVNYILQIYHCV